MRAACDTQRQACGGRRGADAGRDEKAATLRVAKVIGTWLGSLVAWHDDYQGSLGRIEVLSGKKAALERQLREVGVLR